MRAWTLTELFRLTRAELLNLHRDMITVLAVMPDNDPCRPVAVSNLSLVRHVLTRPNPSPG